MTKRFEISSQAGAIYGVYPGDTPEQAFAAMLDDAGGADGDISEWIIVEGQTYAWRTDAASGTVHAPDVDAAIATLVRWGEWAAPGSAREQHDIADGAWLMLSLDGAEVARRGTVA